MYIYIFGWKVVGVKFGVSYAADRCRVSRVVLVGCNFPKTFSVTFQIVRMWCVNCFIFAVHKRRNRAMSVMRRMKSVNLLGKCSQFWMLWAKRRKAYEFGCDKYVQGFVRRKWRKMSLTWCQKKSAPYENLVEPNFS